MPSRFSPGVLPRGDTGLSAFVEALERGVGSYQVARDRKRLREREDDQDAIHGISRERPLGVQGIIPGAPFPEARGAPMDFGPPPMSETAMPGVGEDPDPFLAEVAESSMQPPPAPEPRSASGIPGGFDPGLGRFAKALEPIQLPSGRWYNPQGQVDRRLGEARQRAGLEDEITESRRGVRMGERASQLGALAGSPGFEDLDAGLVTAGSDNDALYNAIVLRNDRQRPIDPLSDRGISQGAKRAGAIHRASGGRSAQEEEAAQEAEGAAWLSENRNNPAVANALGIINSQRPDLARRPGLAAYYVREAMRKSGQMQNVEARTDATVKKSEEGDSIDALVAVLRGGEPAPTGGAPAAATGAKPSLEQRVQQLKAEGLSKEEARARLKAEGYDVGAP